MPALIPGFTDFVKTQSAAYLSDKKQLINDAMKQSYVLGKFLKGKDISVTLQGGSQIKGNAMFDDAQTGTWYSPNDTFSPQNPQVVSTYTADWRFFADHMAWTDQEIELQATSLEQATVMYTDLYRTKQQRMWTSMINKLEKALFAQPVKTTMESSSANPGVMYSLPAFINEQTNGLFNSVTTAATGGAWTTIEGITPTDTTVDGEVRWKPQQIGYTKLSANTSPIGGGTPTDIPLAMALRSAWQKTAFKSPGLKDEFFSPGDLEGQMILTSFTGEQTLEHLYQYRQDQFKWDGAGVDMALGQLRYHGVPVVGTAELDNATLYSKSGATTTVAKEGAAGVTNEADKCGPRFYFVNGKYLHLVIHSNRSFKLKPPMPGGSTQPFSTVQWCDVWLNMVCESLRRQAIVYPTADIWA